MCSAEETAPKYQQLENFLPSLSNFELNGRERNPMNSEPGDHFLVTANSPERNESADIPSGCQSFETLLVPNGDVSEHVNNGVMSSKYEHIENFFPDAIASKLNGDDGSAAK